MSVIAIVTGTAEAASRAEEVRRRLGKDAIVVTADERFGRVVDAFSPELPIPGRGFAEQARRNAHARYDFLERHGSLSAEKVAELAGSHSKNLRATAYRWRQAGRIFGVDYHGEIRYPAFQFDADSGTARPVVAEVLVALPAAMTGWALALWWDTAHHRLGWRTPVETLSSNASAVVAAAEAEAEAWAADSVGA